MQAKYFKRTTLFFFSSRRRHTRCGRDWSSECALPIFWGYSSAIVQRIERARDEGIEVYADQYPYEASSTGLDAALLPRWAQAGGRDSLRARLDDPRSEERRVGKEGRSRWGAGR